MDRTTDDAASKAATTRREHEIGNTGRSLFRRCETSENPVLAYSRACSKVGYLARDGERTELHYLESALNERKLALVMERFGQPEKAREHNQNCGRDFRAFQRAIRTELGRATDTQERSPEPSAARDRAESKAVALCEPFQPNASGVKPARRSITHANEPGLER
jgi:hypothetical protein